MKLKLFLIAASAMALASCSSDEVVKNNEDANAIQFSVVANNGSRAADYFCNAAKPANFQVWAAVGVTYDGEGNVTAGQSYFAGETFERGANVAESNSTIYSIVGDYRYWPDKNTEVSFWAAKNYKDFTWTVGAPTMTFTAANSAASQHDLLYGYTKAYRPTTANKKDVPINLRHALSQIVFQARNENSNIDVEINKVEVVNIINSGTYSLPKGNDVTNGNFNDHKQGTPAPAITGFGKWVLDGTKTTFTTGQFDSAVAVHGPSVEDGTTTEGGQSILVNLTNDRFTSTDDHVTGGDNVTSTNYLKHSLLLIPQDIKKFVKPSGAINNTTTETPYFLVYCKIRNVEAGDGTAETSDIYLWGGQSEYKAIAVPVITSADNTAWAEGKKYVYTFVFSQNGHGGYDPETGNDVLVPIELAVTVDDFSIAADKDVNVDSGIVNP